MRDLKYSIHVNDLTESLLADIEDTLEKGNILTFSIIMDAKNFKEFDKYVNDLLKSCEKISISEVKNNDSCIVVQPHKYKQIIDGIDIGKIFKKSKQFLRIRYTGLLDVVSHISTKKDKNDLINQLLNESYVYILPKNLEKCYINWLNTTIYKSNFTKLI